MKIFYKSKKVDNNKKLIFEDVLSLNVQNLEFSFEKTSYLII